MSWQIKLYETASGQPSVERFIRSLQANTQAKLVRQLDLLAEFGVRLSMPHAKPLGEGLYELRVRGNQEVRVFYVFQTGKTIVVLHGFLKKTQVLPKKELAVALRRKKEVLGEKDT